MTRLWNLSVAALTATLVALPAVAQAPAPAPTTPPAEAKPAEAKPAEAKPAEAPAAEAKPAEGKPAEAPAAEAKPAEAKPAEAPAQGTVSVSSTPSGKVFIDGADTGLSTPVVDLPVAPGKHALKIVSADGREATSEFEIEAGGSLNLNLNLPEAKATEAAPAADGTDGKTEAKAADAKPADPAAPAPAAEAAATTPWTWMTVAGWTGLGLGTIGLLSGSVVLTTPTDQDRDPLGFGLFGAGVGLVIGGGVLLYLDTELADAAAAPAAAPAR